MTLRLGSLCTGYGGLDAAAERVLGTTTAWTAERDPFASAALAHNTPDVPNLGDITAVDWTSVEPVDVLTAGFPCQDISNAGLRVGISGSRSGIWKNVAEAVRVLRPKIVLLENVAAIKNRGLDVVTEDLAGIGYGIRWCIVKASDVGAPHQRRRWFAVAEPLPSGTGSVETGVLEIPAGPLLPTPTVQEGSSGAGRSPKRRGGDNLRTVALELLPTPAARDWKSSASNLHGTNSRPLNEVAVLLPERSWTCSDGRDFGPAVCRWEALTGRPAPDPVAVGPRGGKRVSPAFVEWMMGLPPGLVTDVPGTPFREQLKILGNGVVPQQAEYAYRTLLNESRNEEA